MRIHPTALVDPGAELGPEVEIGPFSVVGKGVVLGARTRVGSHCSLIGPMTLGEDNRVSFACSLGYDPQVKGKTGPFGGLRIGSRNEFREYAQVQRSMRPDGETVVGDDNYLMTMAHIAHDCLVGNHVILCSGVALAGHVVAQDRINIGGGSMVGQFRRLGELAMVGGDTSVDRDVPPFAIVSGERPNRVRGMNAIGMRRAGIASAARLAVKEAFQAIFRRHAPGEASLEERLAGVDESVPEVARLVRFLREGTRPIIGIGGSVNDGTDEDVG